MQDEDQLRRRKMMQDALARGLQRPASSIPSSSFMPGESAGVPTGIKLGGMGAMDRNAGLGLPQPAAPSTIISPDAMPPTPDLPTQPTPSPRIGYSTTGLTGTDALMQRRHALEEADPESGVTRTGEILPPHKTGQLRGLGQGAGLAAAQADPARPMYALGQVIGGGLSGAISPRSSAKSARRFELGQLDNDIARGLKIEGMQADVASSEALRRQRELEPGIKAAELEQEREIANAKLEIERQKASGEITQKEADRQQRELDRRSREKIAADRITSAEKIAATRPSGDETRSAKAAAARQEYDQLVADEATAGENKNKAYAYLEQIKQHAVDAPTGGLDPQYKEDLNQATKAAEDADKLYQSFGEKKRDAQRRMRENQVSAGGSVTTQQPYAGRTMSAANLARYAKDKGISEAEARKQVEAQGVRVQ